MPYSHMYRAFSCIITTQPPSLLYESDRGESCRRITLTEDRINLEACFYIYPLDIEGGDV